MLTDVVGQDPCVSYASFLESSDPVGRMPSLLKPTNTAADQSASFYDKVLERAGIVVESDGIVLSLFYALSIKEF